MSLSKQQMKADEKSYTLIQEELKTHSKPSHRDIPIKFTAYKSIVKLYPVDTLKEYSERRKRALTTNTTENATYRSRFLINVLSISSFSPSIQLEKFKSTSQEYSFNFKLFYL